MPLVPTTLTLPLNSITSPSSLPIVKKVLFEEMNCNPPSVFLLKIVQSGVWLFLNSRTVFLFPIDSSVRYTWSVSFICIFLDGETGCESPSCKSVALIVPLALILPEAVMCPSSFTFILPENVWISSDEFPNWVEPLSKIMLAETNSVWNSWAVIVPVTVKSPVNVSVVFKR